MVSKRVQLRVRWFQRLIGQAVRVSTLGKRWAAPLPKPFGRQLPPAGRSNIRLSEIQSERGSLQLCLSAAATTSTTQGEAENDSEDDLFLEMYYRGCTTFYSRSEKQCVRALVGRRIFFGQKDDVLGVRGA
ncbi:hypothetical protein PAHAL_9G474800 [Panicum hallii]|uniref:Uncharacterized protein n=1 Tax=Panicum hallii TaxID=206008 RepID=A0A2T8I4Z1_9POAL|nr:hypothetical protein PAHAL_9G474800 [Panicum hallii]